MKGIITLILLLAAYCNDTVYTGKVKTLVLLDNWYHTETHSLFWDQLRQMNFELDFKMIDDPNIKLTYFGEYLYNNLIFFAPTYNEGTYNLTQNFQKRVILK
jgi:hypothetical protein